MDELCQSYNLIRMRVNTKTGQGITQAMTYLLREIKTHILDPRHPVRPLKDLALEYVADHLDLVFKVRDSGPPLAAQPSWGRVRARKKS